MTFFGGGQLRQWQERALRAEETIEEFAHLVETMKILFASLAETAEEKEIELAAAYAEIAWMRNALQAMGSQHDHSSASRSNPLDPNIESLKAALRAKNSRFDRAKVAFAKMFHPDAITPVGIEGKVRTEMFKTYWAKLEEIDASPSRP